MDIILSLTIIILILAGNDYYSYRSRVKYSYSYLGARTNTFIVTILDAGGTVVINPEQNNTLICPGESFHYSCDVSGNISITWSVQCPGQRPGSSRTLSVTSTQTEHNRSVNCNYNVQQHIQFRLSPYLHNHSKRSTQQYHHRCAKLELFCH